MSMITTTTIVTLHSPFCSGCGLRRAHCSGPHENARETPRSPHLDRGAHAVLQPFSCIGDTRPSASCRVLLSYVLNRNHVQSHPLLPSNRRCTPHTPAPLASTSTSLLRCFLPQTRRQKLLRCIAHGMLRGGDDGWVAVRVTMKAITYVKCHWIILVLCPLCTAGT